MAATFRTPGRRTGATSDTGSIGSPSMIPRSHQQHGGPATPTGTPSTGETGTSTSSASDSRKRQSKKDEAIRRKLETELGKKGFVQAKSARQKRYAPGTVMALRPSQPLTVGPHTTVADASQIMAAKREDCVLVIDDEQRLSGIFTAKDLAFRVVGQGIDARDILIRDIMTENPICARQSSPATEALEIMVRRGFRHMPVLDEDGDILGILDITKCFYEAMEKLERAYASSKKLYDALEGVQTEWGVGAAQPQQMLQYLSDLRMKMAGPDLSTILETTPPPVFVNVRTTVREAAGLMKENHTTAILVMDRERIAGIFTSKDVVLRVIAAGYDPNNTSVIRVMTPHPDTAREDLSIQAALRKMHDGHYLNLPVVDAQNTVIGIVDVLKLTYATLEQINQMNTPEGEGPMWNRFWNTLDNDTESVHSADGISATAHSSHPRPETPSRHPHHMRSLSDEPPALNRLATDSLVPNDSASIAAAQDQHDDAASASGMIPMSAAPKDDSFVFKFKSPAGRVFRLRYDTTSGYEEFRNVISEKLTNEEITSIGGAIVEDSGFALSFVDDEGDIISILSIADLSESVDIAKRSGREKVDLYIHHPNQPPRIEAPVTAPKAEIPEVMEVAAEKPERNTEKAKNAVEGIPNELLLPGAIVVLAVVVVGIFFAARAGTEVHHPFLDEIAFM